jgi:hypothetical protein
MFLLLVCAAVPAQEATPAPELKKFDKLIGSWSGSGTVRWTHDAKPENWTAEVTARWVLGGHFVEEEVTVNLGPDRPVPLEFRTLHGFDREQNRYVTYSAGSIGESHCCESFWLGDSVYVTPNAGTEGGLPAIDRSMARFSKDSYTYLIERAVGDGPVHVHVEGTFKRGAPLAREGGKPPAEKPVVDLEKKTEKVADKPAGILSGSGERMKALEGWRGTWKIKGRVIPMPGSQPMEISGTETIESLFGGRVLAARMRGDPSPEGRTYEAVAYISWNEHNRCYDDIWANSMGQSGHSEGRFEGKDKLVFTDAGLHFGKPMVKRTVIELDEKGALRRGYSDGISGTTAAERSFEATFIKSP